MPQNEIGLYNSIVAIISPEQIIVSHKNFNGFGGMWNRIDSFLPPNLIADMQVRWDAIY